MEGHARQSLLDLVKQMPTHPSAVTVPVTLCIIPLLTNILTATSLSGKHRRELMRWILEAMEGARVWEVDDSELVD